MRQQMTRIIAAALVAVSLCGCQGLARKFRRENKRAAKQNETNMVVVPEQYPVQSIDRSASYEQAFLFWKSWHEELIAALGSAPNRKKVREALAEALKNLQEMRSLLPDSGQQPLAAVIADLQKLGGDFERDIYAQQLSTHRNRAQSLYLSVVRSFSFSDVKDSLQ